MKKKNWSDKISKEKEDQFEKKMQKLKEECEDVKEVVLQWECEWLTKRKEFEVADFIRNHFKERPRRRLIPRDACKR